MAEPKFWDNKDAADKVIDELKDINTPLGTYEEIGSNLEDMSVYIELYEELLTMRLKNLRSGRYLMANMIRMARSYQYTQVLAAPTLKTGRRCSTACTRDGQPITSINLRSSIT